MLSLIAHLLHVDLLVEGVVGAHIVGMGLGAGDGSEDFGVEVGAGQHELLLVELIGWVAAS